MSDPLMHWLAGRHPYVARILEKAPPGSQVRVGEGTMYVVGVGEPYDPDTNLDGWALHVSPIDPFEDYEGAVAGMVNVCAHHYIDMRGWEVSP